jgi:predicted neuraminidase
MEPEKEIKDQILSLFDKENQTHVYSLLESLTLQHVMAESTENLRNTRLAVLHLSKGDISQLEHYVDAAKKDFRDVLYWISLEKNNKG